MASLRRLDITGSGDGESRRETLNPMLKHWRKHLGYCSIFAAIPAILASHISEARSDEVKKTEATAVGQGATRRQMLNKMLNKSLANPALLKRQSAFRLPHQKGSLDPLSTLGGADDCSGRPIPGGSYSAAAPYIDSGDTSGANDTVKLLSYYYYYSNFDVFGLDHVYSFTLTGRGPNPQIQVSTTAGGYKPMIYVLEGGYPGACPAGTENQAGNWRTLSEAPSHGGTATLSSAQMNFLPLNVPLYLFIDSMNGFGPYAVRMQDVTISPSVCSNPIDCPEFLVRQHYVDFLNREPDPAGQGFWTNEVSSCGADAGCIEAKRINVSAAFFLSIEFQETGYFVYRANKAAYGNLPGLPIPIRQNDFFVETQELSRGVVVHRIAWKEILENNKQMFTSNFVSRSRFISEFPKSMTPTQFVNKLFANAGLATSGGDYFATINEFGSATNTVDENARARALRRVTENPTLAQQEFHRAFVLMQYFGYLRRNPNDHPEPGLNFDGYNFWLNKLNQFNGDYIGAEMIKAFIDSDEYRQRFGT